MVNTDNGDLVGERFGKYLIVGEVALGGMAEVFLAVQRGIEGFTKAMVLKRVLPQYRTDHDFVRMFIDEARLAARLEHPNIVRTYEFGEVAGQYYTTMEYLPGEDLRKMLKKLVVTNQHLPLHHSASIVSRVCVGLHFAHEMTDTAGRPLGLVHRDINPANIVLTYGGEVKIIDFGVAKTTESHTKHGVIKGKLSYMSPEQLLGRGIDRRSDVFSTGVLLWQLLTRRSLFNRENEASTLYAIMNDPILPPSRYRREIPRPLDAIVMRALARTPADRYDSAEEMGNALDAFIATQPPCDARALGGRLENLFDTTRADAKRAITQTCALSRNISLVMKLRTEVRSDLAERLDGMPLAEGSEIAEQSAPIIAEEAASSNTFMTICVAIVVACIAGAVLYLRASGESSAPASSVSAAGALLQVRSTPPGAAIILDGEPTGVATPATLTGLAGKRLTIKLALPGREPRTETIDVPMTGSLAKYFDLPEEATSDEERDLVELLKALTGEPPPEALGVDTAVHH